MGEKANLYRQYGEWDTNLKHDCKKVDIFKRK